MEAYALWQERTETTFGAGCVDGGAEKCEGVVAGFVEGAPGLATVGGPVGAAGARGDTGVALAGHGGTVAVRALSGFDPDAAAVVG
jgi:hypothetical protein